MRDPKIFLCVDNCFAYKRWVKPIDWMLLIRDMGLTYVEQSADTECDPLYMGSAHTAQWRKLTRECSEKTGVRVKNVYSGHGTYATCGLAHWDPDVRARFRDAWMKPQSDTARALDAGFGFFAHGFENSALQSADTYAQCLDTLTADLADLAAYAERIGLSYIGLEQMYTPHMPPWTIDGAEDLIRRVYALCGAPMYITIDVGHMNGQKFFQRPTEDYIREKIARMQSGAPDKRVWMGTAAAYDLYRQAAAGKLPAAEAVERILADAQKNPHLFAAPMDGDIWAWVEALCAYSPIVHLQQHDGNGSPHWPFSAERNKRGLVSGERLFEAMFKSFGAAVQPGMPEAVDEVALTLEPFVGTADNVYDAVDEIAESVAYWRRFVPRDGMRLSEVRALLKQ